MNTNLVDLIYLISAVFFILGIKGLTKPKTAVRGNMLSAIGMLIAVVITLLDKSIVSYEYIIAGVLVGGAIGGIMATRIQMTSMPQMIALLNGCGGGASLGLAAASYLLTSGGEGYESGIMGGMAVSFVMLTVLIG